MTITRISALRAEGELIVSALGNPKLPGLVEQSRSDCSISVMVARLGVIESEIERLCRRGGIDVDSCRQVG